MRTLITLLALLAGFVIKNYSLAVGCIEPRYGVFEVTYYPLLDGPAKTVEVVGYLRESVREQGECINVSRGLRTVFIACGQVTATRVGSVMRSEFHRSWE